MTTLNYTSNKPGFNSRAVGLAGVVIFHALLIYGLVSGLAQDVVKVIQQKVEVAVITELPPPPPPPPPPKVEQVVKRDPPPQPKAYVPPVVTPPPMVEAPENAILATTADPPPPLPVVPADPPPPEVVAAPAGPVLARANCSRLASPEYPAKAQEDEIQGLVKVVFSIGENGKFESIQQISFERISGRYQSAFRSSISRALKNYECKAGALMTQEFSFSLSES